MWLGQVQVPAGLRQPVRGVCGCALTSKDPVADLLAPVLVSVSGENRTRFQNQRSVLQVSEREKP